MVIVIDPQIAGISGDMFLSALIDLGANKSKIINGVKRIKNFDVDVNNIEFKKINKNGIMATTLHLDINNTCHQRKGTEILQNIISTLRQLEVSHKSINFANDVINTIMQAESKIHGIPLDSVYLHELSGIDTIIDVIGVSIALDDLNFFDDDVITAPVAIGNGIMEFSHGIMSNPTSAILEIFKNSQISIFGGLVKSELTTPTGASLLVNLAKNCTSDFPLMKIQTIGYGAGCKTFHQFSNVLKIITGITTTTDHDYVKIIETNVDDISGEILGNLIDKIMMNGAKDITITSAITKKGRPTNIISIICDNALVTKLINILTDETTTLGIRIRTSERIIIPRKIHATTIILSNQKFLVHYKSQLHNNNFKIEFDDIKKISQFLDKPLLYTEQLITKILIKNHL